MIYTKGLGIILLGLMLCTPVWADGNDANTLLLLHCDGADTTTLFPDDSVGGDNDATAVNSAQVDTADQKFGTGSLLLADGTDDLIRPADSADWDWGTGDYTIDFWIKTSTEATCNIIKRRAIGRTYYNYLLQLQSSGEFYFIVGNAGDTAYDVLELTSGADAITGDWVHVAVVRESGTTDIYVGGTSYLTDTTVYNADCTAPLQLGNGEVDARGLTGWMDEIRVSDVARWTSGFTPPTAPYSEATPTMQKGLRSCTLRSAVVR